MAQQHQVELWHLSHTGQRYHLGTVRSTIRMSEQAVGDWMAEEAARLGCDVTHLYFRRNPFKAQKNAVVPKPLQRLVCITAKVLRTTRG